MNTSEVLNKAADLIEERGWHWGSYHSTRQTLCLETALTSALGQGAGADSWSTANQCPAGLALRDYLGLGDWDRQSMRSLWVWNDRDGRTAEEVVEVLRAAALIEAAKENAAVEVRESVTVR